MANNQNVDLFIVVLSDDGDFTAQFSFYGETYKKIDSRGY